MLTPIIKTISRKVDTGSYDLPWKHHHDLRGMNLHYYFRLELPNELSLLIYDYSAHELSSLLNTLLKEC